MSARGPIRVTIVADFGDVVVVGTQDQYESAKTAGLDRYAIGFRRSDLVLSDSGIDTKDIAQA